MPYLRANGCDFYFERSGSGAPLVLLHGETHSIDLFPDQFRTFSREYDCLMYDRRGHARSQVTPYGYSLWNQTHDLKCILDTLGIDRIVLVAVAMSTTIGVTFALHHPERVKALVLCSWYELDGFPRLEQRRKAHSMSFAELHLTLLDVLQRQGRIGLEQYMEENHKWLFPIFPPDNPEVRAELIRIFACHQPSHYAQSGEFYTSMPHLTSEVGKLTCPILGICGSDDPSPDRPELLAHAQNFRQEWIAGARRFTMMENPSAFNETLLRFLRSL